MERKRLKEREMKEEIREMEGWKKVDGREEINRRLKLKDLRKELGLMEKEEI